MNLKLCARERAASGPACGLQQARRQLCPGQRALRRPTLCGQQSARCGKPLEPASGHGRVERLGGEGVQRPHGALQPAFAQPLSCGAAARFARLRPRPDGRRRAASPVRAPQWTGSTSGGAVVRCGPGSSLKARRPAKTRRGKPPRGQDAAETLVPPGLGCGKDSGRPRSGAHRVGRPTAFCTRARRRPALPSRRLRQRSWSRGRRRKSGLAPFSPGIQQLPLRGLNAVKAHKKQRWTRWACERPCLLQNAEKLQRQAGNGKQLAVTAFAVEGRQPVAEASLILLPTGAGLAARYLGA